MCLDYLGGHIDAYVRRDRGPLIQLQETQAVPRSRYTVEYDQAWLRTRQLGLNVPPRRAVMTQDCLNMDQIAPLLQNFLGNLTMEKVAAQCLAVNWLLKPFLQKHLGLPLDLTIGWFDHGGESVYEHGEELLRRLVAKRVDEYHSVGFPLHCWLTSPAYEVLDVTLLTTIGSASP